jgi:hypothetical protein
MHVASNFLNAPGLRLGTEKLFRAGGAAAEQDTLFGIQHYSSEP